MRTTKAVPLLMARVSAISLVMLMASGKGETAPAQSGTAVAGKDEAKVSGQSAPGAKNRAGGMSETQQKAIDESWQEPRKIAAAMVAASGTHPKSIVQVGAHHGEFLEVFLDKFPDARGLWLEPNDDEGTLSPSKARLGRFGNRVDYKFGCGARDISDGCVPQGTDVIVTDWVSILQNLDGMYKIYRVAAERLAPGGWLINLDQTSYGGPQWDRWSEMARKDLAVQHNAPPVHHPDYRTPTVEEQLGAMRAAGLEAHAVWQSFNTVLFVAHKN